MKSEPYQARHTHKDSTATVQWAREAVPWTVLWPPGYQREGAGKGEGEGGNTLLPTLVYMVMHGDTGASTLASSALQRHTTKAP